MSDKPVVIQFIHPGSEYEVSKKKDGSPVPVPWVGCRCDGNCTDHTRRFVSHEGEYVDAKGKKQTAQLGFWTEWEACSLATPMPAPAASEDARLFARWVHEVKSPLCGANGKQNTDPCVFGKSFKYCCCQQTRNGAMRHLAPGSLVFFGSHRCGKFLLDTVFVVDGTGIPYGNGRAEGIDVSREYRRLTLERVWDGEFTFYRGRGFCPGAGKKPFSFTPARPFIDGKADCGKRFALDIDSLNRCLPSSSRTFPPLLNQKFKQIEATPDVIFAVWSEILRQVRAADFVPAVHFDWPK